MSQKLEDLVAGDQAGFELRFGYYLQVKHGLMGFFPGIITASREVILVLDVDLIALIWEIMPPKASEVVKGLFFVNKETGLAFSMSSGRLDELFSLESWQVLNQEQFEGLTVDGARPFSWAPGIFGVQIEQEEFDRLRKRELEKLAA